MSEAGEVWRLLQEDGLVGEIVIEEADFPWLSGRFEATPAFAAWRPLFDRELALLEAEDWDQWEPVIDQICGNLLLAAPTGPVAEFLLHIDGDQAWFRWTNEPFE
ncbi:hypothetical protein ABZW10_38325 [Kitasatospora sp. NPDC004723]|uniref:hypothetical protein n=1 Tax=Kitasatospora sp. NPDC004723 TaxID=3154288 RepID=UPI0033A649F8